MGEQVVPQLYRGDTDKKFSLNVVFKAVTDYFDYVLLCINACVP